jgi:isopenicillin-N N-acyltransferase-like protein
VNAWPLVEVSGSSYEMGRQHGVQAAPLIDRYLRWIEKQTGKARDELGCRARAFLPCIEQLNPQLLDEVRGLADGAGLTFEEALVCQARGAAAAAPLEGSAASVEGCTAFAFTGDATGGRGPLAGQNQDLPPEFADVGIVLHLIPEDGRPRAITFTFAGQLGYMGMNERGVAHFANALGDARWRLALPHYPLKRHLLELSTVGECLEVLRAHRLCSPANMVFCDGAGAIADVEIRPDGIAEYRGDRADLRLHTNHYLTDEFTPFETFGSVGSPERLRRLEELVAEAYGEITVEVLQALMADHVGDPGAICRHGAGGTHSIAGYIAEPAAGRFHVRRGHGCTGTWTAYEV